MTFFFAFALYDKTRIENLAKLLRREESVRFLFFFFSYLAPYAPDFYERSDKGAVHRYSV